MSKPEPKRKPVVFTCKNEGWTCDATDTAHLNLFLVQLSAKYLWKQLDRIENEKWRVTIEAVK